MDEALESFGTAIERQMLVERAAFAALSGMMSFEATQQLTRPDITSICMEQAEDMADYLMSMRQNLIPDE